MTKELRENLVKLAKAHAERTKVSIRKVRQRGIAEARRREDEVSEDTIHRVKKHVSQVTTTKLLEAITPAPLSECTDSAPDWYTHQSCWWTAKSKECRTDQNMITRTLIKAGNENKQAMNYHFLFVLYLYSWNVWEDQFLFARLQSQSCWQMSASLRCGGGLGGRWGPAQCTALHPPIHENQSVSVGSELGHFPILWGPQAERKCKACDMAGHYVAENTVNCLGYVEYSLWMWTSPGEGVGWSQRSPLQLFSSCVHWNHPHWELELGKTDLGMLNSPIMHRRISPVAHSCKASPVINPYMGIVQSTRVTSGMLGMQGLRLSTSSSSSYYSIASYMYLCHSMISIPNRIVSRTFITVFPLVHSQKRVGILLVKSEGTMWALGMEEHTQVN